MSRILVTDDDLTQLDLRKRLLEAAGHEVAMALNSHDTLRELERGWPQLVIMDLRLANEAGEPDAREGMALIRHIHQGWDRMPLIVLSGWPDVLYGQPEEEMISRLMVKPVSSRELLQAVDELTV